MVPSPADPVGSLAGSVVPSGSVALFGPVPGGPELLIIFFVFLLLFGPLVAAVYAALRYFGGSEADRVEELEERVEELDRGVGDSSERSGTDIGGERSESGAGAERTADDAGAEGTANDAGSGRSGDDTDGEQSDDADRERSRDTADDGDGSPDLGADRSDEGNAK